MKKNTVAFYLVVIGAASLICISQSCKKNKDDNGPLGKDPAKEVLNEAVMKAVLDMRIALDDYYDATGIMGREIYRFSPTENRYTTELLGSGTTTASNDQFYITRPWRARYEVVRQAVEIMNGAGRSTQLTDAERRGYTGVAKTLIAHELLMNLNLTWDDGIYINLAAKNPATGPVIPLAAALDTIARLLDEGKDVLTGSALPLLPATFNGFNDAPGFLKFNRALAARVAVYREEWSTALTWLNQSFFDLNGDMQTGPKHVFANFQGDILNPCFIPQNETGNVRLAHPSYAADIVPGDSRINKTSVRADAKSQDGLTSYRDLWLYPQNVTSIPLIRNEELILLYAEAKLRMSQLPDAIVSMNRIRTSHNVAPYGGGVNPTALTNELLAQRRYSLFYEGHRWIDMRRYGRLNNLPLDRPGDDVWEHLPIPQP